MADEIQMTARLYAAKGGAYLGSETTTVTVDMTGTHMATGTQNITFGAGNAELLTVPADVTGDRYLLVKSLEAEGGNFVQFGGASAGSFPASVHNKLLAGRVLLMCIPSANSIYALSDTAAVNIEWKIVQV